MSVNDPLTRAFGYPYPVPDTPDYLFTNGQTKTLGQDFSPGDRVPVLAIGSNRSPQQLLRKYGDTHDIPVTEIVLSNVDVGYCAYLTHYGSVPATLMHAPGTQATLKITWLTGEQLQLMHNTESVGPHTFFGTLPIGSLTIGQQEYSEAYTYVSARGLYNIDGDARAVIDIPAQQRQHGSASQREMLEAVWRTHGDNSFEEWIIQMIDSPHVREATNERMLATAIQALPENFTAIDPGK